MNCKQTCKFSFTYSPYAPSPSVCASVQPSTNSRLLALMSAAFVVLLSSLVMMLPLPLGDDKANIEADMAKVFYSKMNNDDCHCRCRDVYLLLI